MIFLWTLLIIVVLLIVCGVCVLIDECKSNDIKEAAKTAWALIGLMLVAAAAVQAIVLL